MIAAATATSTTFTAPNASNNGKLLYFYVHISFCVCFHFADPILLAPLPS